MSTDSPIVALLTLLLRDHVAIGDMEQAVITLAQGGPYEFDCPLTMQIAAKFTQVLMGVEAQEASRKANEPHILDATGEKV